MRALLAVFVLLLLATTVSARPLPEVPVRGSASYELPSEDCPDCAGATLTAGTYVPDCMDCSGVGAGASLETSDGGVEGWVKVCQTGFVYTCPVDVTL